ncbi:ankyrin containing protein [Acanthamoeba polyphaga lentillevirus]|nr:ankyrin containing protein [Acanthamoeba polyphaga lentillevirus]
MTADLPYEIWMNIIEYLGNDTINLLLVSKYLFFLATFCNISKKKLYKSIIKNGYIDILKYIRELTVNGEISAKIKMDKNLSMLLATKYGKLNIIKYLVRNGTDIRICNNYPVRKASKYGYLDIVKYLIREDCDVSDYDNYALRKATKKWIF